MKYIALAIGMLVSVNGFALGNNDNSSGRNSDQGQKSGSIRMKSPQNQCYSGCDDQCGGYNEVQSVTYNASSSSSKNAGTNGSPANSTKSKPSATCSCECKSN